MDVAFKTMKGPFTAHNIVMTKKVTAKYCQFIKDSFVGAGADEC